MSGHIFVLPHQYGYLIGHNLCPFKEKRICSPASVIKVVSNNLILASSFSLNNSFYTIHSEEKYYCVKPCTVWVCMTASDIRVVPFIHLDLCSRGGILVQKHAKSKCSKSFKILMDCRRQVHFMSLIWLGGMAGWKNICHQYAISAVFANMKTYNFSHGDQ